MDVRTKAIAVIVLFLISGCAPRGTMLPVKLLSRIESELKRGGSTKEDVQRLLGPPKGVGNSIFPTDPRSSEVWYYGVVSGGVTETDLRQYVVLIFFEKEVFDGFFWLSSDAVATLQ